MRIVIALGGNALLQRGEPLDVDVQRHNVRRACAAVAPLAERHRIVLTHGNGPQVGLLALQAAALDDVEPYPLDVLGAESEGMIGYLLEQELLNEIRHCRVANLITQTLVDADDPAFQDPTKFVGRVYDAEEAAEMAVQHNWLMKADGQYVRRVVPSPRPKAILELTAIRTLSEAGHIVICTGGGGVPVVKRPDGKLRGIEAVIDKDLASALLARQLGVDALLLLTDVDAVYRDWGSTAQTPIRTATVDELDNTAFAKGSMGPKVEAACDFVRNTGGFAGIGTLEDAAAILEGKAGTALKPTLSPTIEHSRHRSKDKSKARSADRSRERSEDCSNDGSKDRSPVIDHSNRRSRTIDPSDNPSPMTDRAEVAARKHPMP